MAANSFAFLENRSVIHVNGSDAAEFLQGLITNDITLVDIKSTIWAALLTPQGKFLHEFMVAMRDKAYILDCELDRRPDLIKRLSQFKLRAKVIISKSDILSVAAAWGPDISLNLQLDMKPGFSVNRNDVLVFFDPRLAEAGVRLIGKRENIETIMAESGFTITTQNDFDTHRIGLGLPDGSRDMEIGKALILENGFEELGGVDFKKGCYIGQELTARTYYRALIKKRLIPVRIEGDAPPNGTSLSIEGVNAGEMRSSAEGYGLALIRLVPWQESSNGVLTTSESRLFPTLPSWLTLPTNK